MNRYRLKRLKYEVEDWPSKPFTKMRLSGPAGASYTLQPMEEKLPELSEDLMDFSLQPRQKNCGLGDNFVAEVKAKQNSGFFLRFHDDYQADEAVRIRYDMDQDNDRLFDMSLIMVPDKVQAAVVIYYGSDETACFRNGLLRVHLGREASLRLIKVQNLSDASKNFETMRVDSRYKTVFQNYPVEFGAGLVGTSCSTYMPEDWGDIAMYPLYFTDGTVRMDLEQNLIVNGQNSLGIINAKGCMKDKSFKVFRGNIFLNKGCRRSIGRFANSDILLDKGIKAQSIPTILCDEDDVMGEHAASFEAINKDKMFYLMSRGFDEVAAKKLIVEASFRPVFELIEEEEIRELLMEQLGRRLLEEQPLVGALA